MISTLKIQTLETDLIEKIKGAINKRAEAKAKRMFLKRPKRLTKTLTCLHLNHTYPSDPAASSPASCIPATRYANSRRPRSAFAEIIEAQP